MSDQIEPTNVPPPSNRSLLRLVYGLGIVLVLLLFAVIGGIVYKINKRDAPPPPAGSVNLGLPPQAEIRDAQLAGDRLTINTGSEVIIVEVSTQRVLLRVRAVRE